MAGFKIHARVLDLLGAEQIADLPTAISELFKNAYDANANRAVLDVYKEQKHAVFWDDGCGMCEKDLLNRWLVVGTPGKINEPVPAPPKGKKARPVMGEKGIGRLAIATLGDTLLLVTKQSTHAEADPYSALLINWNVARNPHLMLADVSVPVITFGRLDELDAGIVADMAEAFCAPLLAKESDAQWPAPYDHLRSRIISQVKAFKPELTSLLRSGFDRFDSGTLFYIADVLENLWTFTSVGSRHDQDSDPGLGVIQLLSNFSNPFTNTTKKSVTEDLSSSGDATAATDLFDVDVRVWDKDLVSCRSLFADYAVFQLEDVAKYDHLIRVAFDKEGRYEGVVEVYGKAIPLTPAVAQPSTGNHCGPFELRMWYWQGKQGESTLDAASFQRINSKLMRFGGLMVYRDGLRVLPYGVPEIDWLKFEERRSKHAGRSFFSYRRMFGYVAISRSGNSELRDKAGREGLINNAAYRGLRDTLTRFFQEISITYFGETAEFRDQKEDIAAQKQLVDRAAQRATALRKKWADQLSADLEAIRLAAPQLPSLEQVALDRIRTTGEDNPAGMAAVLLDFEQSTAALGVDSERKVPRNLPIRSDDELRRLVYDYRTSIKALIDAAGEARKRLYVSAGMQLSKKNVPAACSRLLATKRSAAKDYLRTASNDLQTALDAALKELRQWVTGAIGKHRANLDLCLNAEASTESISAVGDIALQIDKAVHDSTTALRELGARIGSHVHEFLAYQTDEETAAQIDEIEYLRDDLRKMAELAQIGLSVEIIDHELNRLYRGIKGNITELTRHMSRQPATAKYLASLEANFQHLEVRYRQMRPLYRTSYRIKRDITGRSILDFVRSFLSHEVETNCVRVDATPQFMTFTVCEAPAVVYPVFVNLVDNAIYWLRDAAEKSIVLDVVDRTVTVCDTGPGIHNSALDRIFDAFVTTKPKGRGLGLFIARQTLGLSGHEIWATNELPYRKLCGACFCLQFREELSLASEGDK